MLLAGQRPDHYQVPALSRLPRRVYVRAFDIPAHSVVAMHQHPWAQFMHATAGILCVQTPQASYMVPPQHAVWIPPGLPHGVSTHGQVAFHSLYVDLAALADFSLECRVVVVAPLVRELLKATAGIPVEYAPGSTEDRLMQVVIDQIKCLPAAELCLPLPADSRLLRITQALQAQPGDSRTLDEWGTLVGATRRTLARLFRDQTRMSFGQWRQSLRLLAALPRLESGATVTAVASELGYESTSAFIAAFRRHHGKTPGAFFGSRAGLPGEQA